jgi:hypothetical protein
MTRSPQPSCRVREEAILLIPRAPSCQDSTPDKRHRPATYPPGERASDGRENLIFGHQIKELIITICTWNPSNSRVP